MKVLLCAVFKDRERREPRVLRRDFCEKRERNPRAVPSKLSSAACAHSLAPAHRRSTTHVRKYDFVVSLLDPDTR